MRSLKWTTNEDDEKVIKRTGDSGTGCCCDECSHALLGDTVHVTISGILLCDGCYADAVNPNTNFSGTGINGVFDALWDGVGSWTVVVGTFTVHTFDTGASPCTIEIGSTTSDAVFTLLCSDGAIQVGITAGGYFIFSGTGSPAPNGLAFCAAVPPQASTTGFISIST